MADGTRIAPEIHELREVGEDAGDLMGFYCKGHIGRHEFAKAVNDWTGADPVYDRRYVRPEDSRHEWWRCVPISGEPGLHRFDPAVPGTRGAFAVTVCDALYLQEVRLTRRRIHDCVRHRAQGLAEGVNWAMTTLANHSPSAADFLSRAWRAQHERLEDPDARL